MTWVWSYQYLIPRSAAEVRGMINPAESLAFSMHANPGVYAILAGSGMSRAAKIPTGWEITLDLIRKLAALRGEKCDGEPAQWYQRTFKKQADYSDLLDGLCGTATERQQLLRGYIEPSTSRIARRVLRQPTAAHRALAALTAKRLRSGHPNDKLRPPDRDSVGGRW